MNGPFDAPITITRTQGIRVGWSLFWRSLWLLVRHPRKPKNGVTFVVKED